MRDRKKFDVIIVGGSYSGLAAGMALGRALKRVLIIDSGKPCNIQTPYAHNFLTHDGKPPASIAVLSKHQVQAYKTITFLSDVAVRGTRIKDGFEIQVASGETFGAGKLIFATGIKDMMPTMEGFAACWGISVIHCPYCHGYEVRNSKTGILGNGTYAYELSRLISNWATDLTLYTNGMALLTQEQREKLRERNIHIVEEEVEGLAHEDGWIRHILFRDGTKSPVETLYAPAPFEQHCSIPDQLGCALTDDGYIQADSLHETTVTGVYACGDNATRMRTLANAVATGTAAGITVSKRMIVEEFENTSHHF